MPSQLYGTLARTPAMSIAASYRKRKVANIFFLVIAYARSLTTFMKKSPTSG